MDKAKSFHSWPEEQIDSSATMEIGVMSEDNKELNNPVVNAFDFEIEKPTSKGKMCHMQVDEDLHIWLNNRRTELGCSFREFANMLLCKGIQQYIVAKKLPRKIKDRTK